MSYNTEKEQIYKDLNQLAQQQRDYETLVIDFSRETKNISQEAIDKILTHLTKRVTK